MTEILYENDRNTVLVTEILNENDRNRVRNTTKSLTNYLCITQSVFRLGFEYETEKQRFESRQLLQPTQPPTE